MTTGRLEAFSDGVLAIVITIMVLGLATPTGSSFRDFFAAAGIGLMTYLLSFVYVGIYWNNHHHLFQITRRVSGGVLWANLAWLFFISLLPLTTSWMGNTDFARAPVILYGVDLLLVALAFFNLQRAAIRAEGPDSELRAALGRDWKGKLSVVLYLVGITAAVLASAQSPWGTGTARAAFLVVAVVWVIPDRRITQVYGDGRATPER